MTTNKIWFITGAGRGMGVDIAKAALAAGHKVVATGRNTDKVAATDMAKVRQRKRDMVNREIDFHLQQYKTTGAELIMGTGRFVAPKTLEVRLNDGGTRVLAGHQVFLPIRTHPPIPPFPPPPPPPPPPP